MRKSSKKSKPKSLLKKLKNEAWELVKEIVRKNGADKDGFNNCFTCQARMYYKELHTGHHFHGRLDYDLRNLRPQCPRCNKWLHGNLGIYAARLIKEHGLEWYEVLKKDAQPIQHYTTIQLKEIIDELRLMVTDK